jgi:hypothetical protein
MLQKLEIFSNHFEDRMKICRNYTYLSLLESGFNFTNKPFKCLRAQPELLSHPLGTQRRPDQTFDQQRSIGISLDTEPVLPHYHNQTLAQLFHTYQQN